MLMDGFDARHARARHEPLMLTLEQMDGVETVEKKEKTPAHGVR